MIIIYLKGGLGNQLFQYALGKAIEKRGQQVKYDISSFEGYRHNFCFGYFKIGIRLLSEEDEVLFYQLYEKKKVRLKGKKGSLNKVLRRLLNFYDNYYYVTKNTIHERGFMDKRILSVRGNKVLEGYWAKPAYFNLMRTELIEDLNLNEKYLYPAYQMWTQRIKQTNNAVSIHIRRGNYLDDVNKKLFIQLNSVYYQKAFDLIINKTNDAHFFIFSDDIQWCINLWGEDKRISYITSKNKLIDVHDFSLMKQCKHNIIANSTFSWWAAYLNDNPDKIVIAPRKWYVNQRMQKKYESGDFIPKNWIKI